MIVIAPTNSNQQLTTKSSFDFRFFKGEKLCKKLILGLPLATTNARKALMAWQISFLFSLSLFGLGTWSHEIIYFNITSDEFRSVAQQAMSATSELLAPVLKIHCQVGFFFFFFFFFFSCSFFILTLCFPPSIDRSQF